MFLKWLSAITRPCSAPLCDAGADAVAACAAADAERLATATMPSMQTVAAPVIEKIRPLANLIARASPAEPRTVATRRQPAPILRFRVSRVKGQRVLRLGEISQQWSSNQGWTPGAVSRGLLEGVG